MVVNKHITLEKPQINEKYTVVDKDNGCVVLPCWFVLENNTHRNFLIRGKVVKPEKNMKVFVNVDKSLIQNENDIATVTINDNGKDDKLSDVEVPIDKNGNFDFKITLSLKNNVDLSKIYRLKIKYNARLTFKKWFITKETDYELENEQSFEIFVRGALSNTWLGLDPGTSGSCVCIGRGGSINNPNISHLGDEIIPSVVVIPRTTEVKTDFREYVPGSDFLYGNEARQQWLAQLNSGGRGFVSIKKLLGYNSQKIPVIMKNGTADFSGAEIAHLLIKGINKDIQANISNFTEEEKRTYVPSGSDCCNRLVVAIPNNYTLPKILDMVQSIQWLNEYEEIRYIYEPEAIVFNYLMKEFQTISSKNGEIVMVFDMGGSTINVSVYRLEVKGREDGSDQVYIKTLGKVGYAVGGDNIDFALIETLLGLYISASKNNLTKDERLKFETKYKDELLPKIFELKLALIEAKKEDVNYNGIFSAAETFIQFVNQCFEHLIKSGFKPIDEKHLRMHFRLKEQEVWLNYRKKIIDELLNTNEMNHYVFDRVKEAVSDVISSINDEVKTMIFSGRSVLFPGIKEAVKEVMPTKGVDIEWNGMSDREIKSAVAKGACWYGMYSTSICLDNELITSSYGYGMTIDGVYRFCPVIDSCNTFDKDGVCCSKHEIASAFNNDANIVKFYQMMGNTNSQLFDENAKYKRAYLGYVQIYTNTKSIEMSVDRNDNIDYKVNFEDDNKYSSGLMHSQNRDITDENDLAYYFATLSSEQKILPIEDDYAANLSEADGVLHQYKSENVETISTEVSEEKFEKEGDKPKSKRTRI